MASKPKGPREELHATQFASGEGRSLAETMPRLILEARRIAATVIHGLHGRKRSGPGENFWQYRRFVSGEPARRVDWRRSARDEHLYVRELEWEAAHTVWIWADRSPSMHFKSRAGPGVQARPHAGGGVRAGRGPGAGRRARRHAGPDAADRQPQRARQDRQRHPARSHAAREPAGRVRALGAGRDRGDFGFLEPDRRGAQDAGATVGDRCARPHRAGRRSGRGDLSVFGPRRVHRAGRRRLDHRRPRRGLEGGLRGPGRAPPRRDPRRDRQDRLELRHPPHRPDGDRTDARAARPHGRAAARRRRCGRSA